MTESEVESALASRTVKTLGGDAAQSPGSLAVCTWNAEWAEPGTERGDLVRRRLLATESDLIVLTEGCAGLLPDGGHTVDAGADWGYRVRDPERRKVLMWSREPWRSVTAAGSGSAAGRIVSARTDTRAGEVTVIGVCIPWRDAHVRTGRRDRRPWQEHLEYLDVLGAALNTHSLGSLVIAGDLNQRIPRTRQPVEAASRLMAVIESLTLHTGGETDDGRLIDHVITTGDLRCRERFTWPGEQDGRRTSDHAGVCVRLERAL